MRNGTFTAISVNKICRSQVLQPPPNELVSLEETQERKNTCHLAAIGLQPLSMVTPEETQDVKTQDTDPRELRCVSKE